VPERLEDKDDRRRAYRYLFARGRVGPKVLADLMAYAGILDAGMEADDRSQEFWSGRRDVVLYILTALGLSHDYEAIARAILRAPVKEPQPQQEEGDYDADGRE